VRILETERLVLEEFTVDRDEAFILELVDGPGFRQNIGDRGVRDLDGARGYIEGVKLSYAKHGFGLWRADLKASGEAVGICGLVKRDSLELPDVGYAFLERFWGQGFATEAAAAILDHGRRVLGLPAIAAITTPKNAGSIAVLRKIGMKYLGLRQLAGADHESSYFETA
jgi:RimJ/RimL family protein N-acetyltransferase